MIKIKPTSRLPYTKQQPAGDIEQSRQNSSIALSAKVPQKVHIDGNLFGGLSSYAAYREHFRLTTNPHTAALRNAWKSRKTP